MVEDDYLVLNGSSLALGGNEGGGGRKSFVGRKDIFDVRIKLSESMYYIPDENYLVCYINILLHRNYFC